MMCFQLAPLSPSLCLPFHRNSFCHDLEQLLARGPGQPADQGSKGGRGTRTLQECPNTFTVAGATSTGGGGFNDDSTALLARSANGISCSRTRFCPDQIPGERTPADGDRLLDGRPRSRLLLRRSTCGPPRRAKARGSSTLKHMCKKLKQFLKEYSLN